MIVNERQYGILKESLRKRIIISESQLEVIREYENGEVLRNDFETRVRKYMKQLQENPCKPEYDSFFTDNGIPEEKLMDKMIDLGIISKKDGITEPEDASGNKHSVHTRKFIFSSKDFDNKMDRLYRSFFSNGKRIDEDDCGGACAGDGISGGATNAEFVGGQYTVPFGGIQRRKVGTKRSGSTESNIDMTPAFERKKGKIAVNTVNEAKSIKSGKLAAILKQHGGIWKDSWQKSGHRRNFVATDLQNMDDSSILCVMAPEEIKDLQKGHDVDHWRWADNYGLDKWARENGFKLEKGDRVETLRLADGMYLIYVERNAEFENSGKEGGYKDYARKVGDRRKNQRYVGNGEFEHTTDKGKAAMNLRKNPYFANKSKGTSLSDSSARRREIDKIKNL